jgi:glutaminyl-peptide cyclotransferase
VRVREVIAIAGIVMLAGCTFSPERERAAQFRALTPTGKPGPAPMQLTVDVVATYPHDTSAFTQGLVMHDGVLYESTGRYFRSTLRRVDVVTGAVLQSVSLGSGKFGEGLALVRGRLVQLTWRNGVAFVYDAGTLQTLRTFSYTGEGWGLCFDGTTLAMSDGTDRLTFRDPDSFEVLRDVAVTQAGQPVALLNELECVRDSVYANVWRADTIVEISSRDGSVRAVIDASGLLTAEERAALGPDAVLNGIAYDAATETYLLTGKLWPKLFRVRFVAPSGPRAPRTRGTTTWTAT